jgi:hypothetical protein
MHAQHHDDHENPKQMEGAARVAAMLVSLLLVVGCAPVARWAPRETDLPAGGRVEVALLVYRGTPAIVQPGATPYGVVIDTGTTAAALDAGSQLARELPSRQVAPYRIVAFGGAERTVEEVRHADSFQIGAARFLDFDAAVADLSPLLGGGEPPVAGMLGLAVFRDCVLTIDGPGRRLVLEKGSLPDADGRDILPLRSIDGGPPRIPIVLDGRRIWAQLDTGFTGTIELTGQQARRTKYASDILPAGITTGLFGTARAHVAQLAEDVWIGRHMIPQPVVSTSSRHAGGDGIVNLGWGLLRNFTVSIDQHKRVVRLSRASTQPLQLPGYASFGFDTARDDHGRLHVVDVYPGSDAERAGIKIGDELISINGVPTAELSNQRRWELAMSRPTADVVLRRGSEEIRVRVPVLVLPAENREL